MTLEAMDVQPVHAIPSSGTGHKIQSRALPVQGDGSQASWSWLNSQALTGGSEQRAGESCFLLSVPRGFSRWL